ncbi:MAG: RnfH family protein [Haliea sp.]|jgi:putative ubiquitin-RnfH superfamily antitoxin RatB of RatAB toxin-antitoxin module|uniref:RnfH family protein n=1 Tax=Haliea sp. TaxID=1932666 RepID=UPI000C6190D4|nr:RnfH family protein [Haliea sp.]MBM69801.1 RnfH family protein [Haliea sp.]|tara:strand:+ start:10008 stop:10322 length:315 start_codon:yes stop_codon:yes gene_type:complete
MSETDMIQVEVAYALPDRQAIIPVNVAAGTTALEAARRSGVAQRFEGLNLEDSRLGIFGKLVAPDQVLQAGDRVEIYRPLKADPKEVRKARAARVKERRQDSDD